MKDRSTNKDIYKSKDNIMGILRQTMDNDGTFRYVSGFLSLFVVGG